MVQKFPHQITSYAILMFEKGNDSVAFFLHCLGGPARTGHPGRCRARCSAHLRTPILRHRRSPPAAEGPEKFSNSPDLPRSGLAAEAGDHPGPPSARVAKARSRPRRRPALGKLALSRVAAPGPARRVDRGRPVPNRVPQDATRGGAAPPDCATERGGQRALALCC